MQEALYVVTFQSGESLYEFGKDVADVRAFIARSYKHMGTIVSVRIAH